MCGVSAKCDSPKCLHCGTRLATVSCPSCFAMMFEGSRYCPHCGAKAERIVTAPAALPCPRCKGKSLDHVFLGETPVSECPGCQGLWVDVPTFEAICTDRERQSILLGSARPSPGKRQLETKIQYVRCPVCNDLMHRVNFAKCSGVVIDVCKAHGSWFDQDELQHIVEFIRKGGMDVARSREKAELEQARRRLEAARSAPKGNWDPGHRVSSGRLAEGDLFDIAGSLVEYFLTRG